MRRWTATEARKNFFKLLDKALKGEKVIIERDGAPLSLVRVKPERKDSSKKQKPNFDYRELIRGSTDDADQWHWDWIPDSGLSLKK